MANDVPNGSGMMKENGTSVQPARGNAGGEGISKSVFKNMDKATVPLFINVAEITKKLRSPKERKDGLALLKNAFEKILEADGGTMRSAHCEFEEKKLELALNIDGKEFAKVTANWKSVFLSQNGETRDLGNYDLVQGQAFTKLLAELGEANGVKVEFA